MIIRNLKNPVFIAFLILLILSIINVTDASCQPGNVGPTGRTGNLGNMGGTGPTGSQGATGPVASVEISQPYREYYVSKQGSDTTGTGSSLEPFQTAQKALNVIGSASSTIQYNNITTAMSTVYFFPGSYTIGSTGSGSLIIPTRQVIILQLMSAQIIGNIQFAMQGNVMANLGGTGSSSSILESKLIIRGSDIRSVFPIVGGGGGGVIQNPQTSAIIGNITLSQVGGTSNLNTQTLELLNAGVSGNIVVQSGVGTVAHNTKVLSNNGILLGALTVQPGAGTCILYIKNSDTTNRQGWGGVNGDVYLFSLSHVRFLGAVVLQGNVSTLSAATSGTAFGAGSGATWHAVQFALGPAHNFSRMTGAVYSVDDNSFASYMSNVPHKGSEIFYMLDTKATGTTGANGISQLGAYLTLPSPNSLSTNVGAMIFDTTKNLPVWRIPITSGGGGGWFNNSGAIGPTGFQGPPGVSFQVDAQGVLNNATIAVIESQSQSQADHLWYYVVTVDERSDAQKIIPIPAGLPGDVSLHLIVCYYTGTPNMYIFTDFGEFTGKTGATGATGPIGLIGGTGGQGAVGNTGATGGVGGQGASGLTGATGGTGATGAVGGAGAQGSTGSTGATGGTGANGATGATGFSTTGITSVSSSTSFITVSNPTTTPSVNVAQAILTSSSPTFSSITASSFIGHATLDLPLTGGQITGELTVGSSTSPSYDLDVLPNSLTSGVAFAKNVVQSWFSLNQISVLNLLGQGNDYFGYYEEFTGGGSDSDPQVTLPMADVSNQLGVGTSFFSDCYVFTVTSSSGSITLLTQGGNIIDWFGSTGSSLTITPFEIFYVCADGVNTWIGFFNH